MVPFWISVVFSLVIHSATSAPWRHLLISNASLSRMEENILNLNPTILSRPAVFQFDIFLVLVWINRSVFPLSDLLWVILILLSCCLFIRLFVIFSWLPYFSPKSFGFSCIRLLVCFRVYSPNLLKDFFFAVLESPDLSVSFYLCRSLFNLPSFAITFWFISSSCIVIFSCVAFSFLSSVFLVLKFLLVFVNFLSVVPILFTHPSARAGYDTRSIFKRSLTGLNSELSFS